MPNSAYSDGLVARAYMIRHLSAGMLWDCVYLEPPDDAEIVSVCGTRGLDVARPDGSSRVRVVEVAIASGRAELAPLFDQLDPWVAPHPPAMPDGVSVREDVNAGRVYVEYRASGVGRVVNPGDPDWVPRGR